MSGGRLERPFNGRPEEMKGPRREDIGISRQKMVDILERLIC